jgi:HSP20 family molecular chaperone IbpA
MARIEHSIDVNVPLHAAYNQWTQFEEFPRFMDGVREVRQLDDAHLHWRAFRHGKELEWDSEITDQVPDQRIVWRDTSGPGNAGSVTFHAVDADKTRVHITMECARDAAPEQAALAEQAIAQRVEQDLVRFKTLLERQGSETGAWRGEIHHGQTMHDVDATTNPNVDADTPAQFARSGGAGGVAAQARGDKSAGIEPPQSAAPIPGTAQKTTPFEAAQAGGEGRSRVDVGQQTRGDADPRTTSFGGAGEDAARAGGRARAGSEQTADKAGSKSGTSAGTSASTGAGSSPNWFPNLLQGWEEPMSIMRKMTEEMDQLFDRFIGRPISGGLGRGGVAGKWMPPIEVSQQGNDLLVCADLPGLSKDDVQITIALGKLTIEGERNETTPEQTLAGYRRSERSYGPFYRMIPLPEGVNAEAASATMRDGVLTIRVPLPNEDERRGRKLDIQPPH